MDKNLERSAVLAGTWYPGQPDRLRETVAGFLDDAAAPPRERPRVLMVPHAGFPYSGRAAGLGYRCLRNHVFERIVLLAPNHRKWLESLAAPACRSFATPLGSVELDQRAIEKLIASPAIESDGEAHAQEHAVEIQLPFLQMIFADPPPVVPLLVPHLSAAGMAEAREALQTVVDASTLILVSTDMTHYGQEFGFAPFPEDPQSGIRDLDQGAIDLILDWNAPGLLAYGERTGITMCGLQAMALAMSLLPVETLQTRLVTYCRSGDRDQDYDFSVSYCTIIAVDKP
jgi:MEMO1 family protein